MNVVFTTGDLRPDPNGWGLRDIWLSDLECKTRFLCTNLGMQTQSLWLKVKLGRR